MSLRHGVSSQEEHKLKSLIAKGKTWEEIVASGELLDVDLGHAKKHIYDPLVKKHEEAKKAGHKDIHAQEAHETKKRAAAKKAKEAENDE